jgi:hypothetical protein
MTFAKMLGVTTLAVAALAIAVPTAVTAAPHHQRPHKVKVCKWERHHGKRVKACHWVTRR